jgi:hypothetical protein
MLVRSAFFLFLLCSIHSASALDAFEIQVYDAEIDKPNEAALEVHLNNVLEGNSESDYPGGSASNHLTHMTLEPSIGMTPFWEIGGYLQFGMFPDGHTDFAGVKFRNKFILPQDKSSPWQFGSNFEVSYIPHLFEESLFGGEIRPILGYTIESWTLLLNPILSFAFSTPSQTPVFEPALKLLWNTHHGFAIGPEYYASVGPLDMIPSIQNQEHLLFLALDLLNADWEWNVGFGRGLTDSANSWTVKTIIGHSL